MHNEPADHAPRVSVAQPPRDEDTPSPVQGRALQVPNVVGQSDRRDEAVRLVLL
jgi:hypothetical protein